VPQAIFQQLAGTVPNKLNLSLFFFDDNQCICNLVEKYKAVRQNLMLKLEVHNVSRGEIVLLGIRIKATEVCCFRNFDKTHHIGKVLQFFF
jgi:hypothetical protein